MGLYVYTGPPILAPASFRNPEGISGNNPPSIPEGIPGNNPRSNPKRIPGNNPPSIPEAFPTTIRAAFPTAPHQPFRHKDSS